MKIASCATCHDPHAPSAARKYLPHHPWLQRANPRSSLTLLGARCALSAQSWPLEINWRALGDDFRTLFLCEVENRTQDSACFNARYGAR